jgi:hypothetical protein
MAMTTQKEADDVVFRVKKLVDYFGGKNDILIDIKKWYSIFHSRPEHGALVVLEAEIDKLEKKLIHF